MDCHFHELITYKLRLLSPTNLGFQKTSEQLPTEMGVLRPHDMGCARVKQNELGFSEASEDFWNLQEERKEALPH